MTSYVLVLTNRDGLPIQIIGPFEDKESIPDWISDHHYTKRYNQTILPLDSHGLDD